MQRQYNLADVHAWLGEERGNPEKPAATARDKLLDTLAQQIEQDRKLPQPAALIPGSPERLVAEARQRRIGQLASILGYQPAGREAVTEVIRDRVLDAAGVSQPIKMAVAAMGEQSDGSSGGREQKQRGMGRAGRDGGRGFGLGLDLAG